MTTANHHKQTLTASDLRRYIDKAAAYGITDQDEMNYNPKENSLDFTKLDGTLVFRVYGMPDDVRINAMMDPTVQ